MNLIRLAGSPLKLLLCSCVFLFFSFSASTRSYALGLAPAGTHLWDTIEVIGDPNDTVLIFEALNEIRKSRTGKCIVEDLEKSSNRYTIEIARNSLDSGGFIPFDPLKAYKDEFVIRGEKDINDPAIQGGSGGSICWNIDQCELEGDNPRYVKRSSIALAHELSHASDANHGLQNDAPRGEIDANEYQATHKENMIRSELGIPLRTYYGLHIFTDSATGMNIYQRGVRLIRKRTFSAYFENYNYAIKNPPSMQDSYYDSIQKFVFSKM